MAIATTPCIYSSSRKVVELIEKYWHCNLFYFFWLLFLPRNKKNDNLSALSQRKVPKGISGLYDWSLFSSPNDKNLKCNELQHYAFFFSFEGPIMFQEGLVLDRLL